MWQDRRVPALLTGPAAPREPAWGVMVSGS